MAGGSGGIPELMMTLNCDLGETWELRENGTQRRLLELIDLANVGCGAHAGDAALTEATFADAAEVCRTHPLRVGAHPGYPDLEHFGRRPLYGIQFDATGIVDLVSEQVQFAMQAARRQGLTLYHVKPHGALYNEAAVNGEVAEAIALGVRRVVKDIFLVGLAGSVMVNVFRRQGFVVLREAFADRRYTAQGLLVPRTEPGAMIETPEEALEQRKRLEKIADTLCVHGDGPQALEFVTALRR